MHSVFSDGKYTPAELAGMCKAAGLSMFAVTDHDNMGGSEEAQAAAIACGLHVVRGWEVSSYEGACKVHILGYGCQKNEAYETFLAERFEGGRIRAEQMRVKANAYFGLDVTMDEIEAYHVRKCAPLHTMHVVKAFSKRLSRKAGDIYQEVFARGGPAFSEECRPTPQASIDVIHATGGIAVLAHPGRILDLSEEEIALGRSTEDPEIRAFLREKSDKNRTRLINELTAYGLDGIECIYTTHTAIQTEEFLAFAARHGLLVTGGSDFHAEGARNVLGLPVFDVGEELAERLLRLDGSV